MCYTKKFLCVKNRMNSILIVVILVTLFTYLLPKYPDPTVIKNLMNESERRYIIQEASNKLETSMISRDKLINESIRKSETAWLNKEDPVVKSIIHRCLKYTDRPFENCEKLQVVRYKPGVIINLIKMRLKMIKI